jgi:putative IMPACT (imprinted ancient) family translation regulator
VFTTLAKPSQHSEVVKNSEFLGFAVPAPDVPTALSFVAGLRLERPDASHVAWAYKIGAAYRFSDDGEPSGTAGAPIFRVLEMSGFDYVAIAVVRYYGGVNLGAGGLARAYGGTAAETLRVAERLEVHPRIPVTITVGFEAMGALYRILESFNLSAREDAFTEHGLTVRCDLLETDYDKLTVQVRDATRGAGVIERQ